MGSTLEGIIVQKSSRDLRVDTAEGILRCGMRGRHRSDAEGKLPAAVGDRVTVTRLGAEEGILEEILPRRSRMARGTAGGESLLVAANVDQLLIVLAARKPPPRWALVDRMIIAAEREGLLAVICLNKADQLAGDPDAAEDLNRILEIYRGLEYPVHFVSAAEKRGLDELLERLQGKITVVSGHSGVGKSTLLNALCPSLRLQTGDLNAVTGKGRQTTTSVSLERLSSGGYVADTPGFREFMPVDLEPAEVGRHYTEFRRAMDGKPCRFSDCLHGPEPACSVLAALERGEISKLRYENYLQILSSIGRSPGSRRVL